MLTYYSGCRRLAEKKSNRKVDYCREDVRIEGYRLMANVVALPAIFRDLTVEPRNRADIVPANRVGHRRTSSDYPALSLSGRFFGGRANYGRRGFLTCARADALERLRKFPSAVRPYRLICVHEHLNHSHGLHQAMHHCSRPNKLLPHPRCS
jgi:hypothetical protein